jgi:hypothetical protein
VPVLNTKEEAMEQRARDIRGQGGAAATILFAGSLVGFLGLPLCAQSRPSASQNPSPMVELTRAHERLTARPGDSTRQSVSGPTGTPVDVFVPARSGAGDAFDLVVHFHGASWLAHQAVVASDRRIVTAVVNLGAGSGGYDRAFSDPASFDSLLTRVERAVSGSGKPRSARRVTLVGFSAGHGAVRAILRTPRLFARVHAVLLIDGMHTSYIPEGTVLDLGGAIDTTNLVAFADFARAAIRGEKRFVVTHSEIFPGTFVSTTESADWLLRTVGVPRSRVLRWGPRGTQQLSEARSGGFELLGFAGNSAPDHVDQLHAMPEFVARVLRR